MAEPAEAHDTPPSPPTLDRKGSATFDNWDGGVVAERETFINDLRTRDITFDAGSAAEMAIVASAKVGNRHSNSPSEFTSKRTLGTEIHREHHQYALTYGMMLGIRVTTGFQDVKHGKHGRKLALSDFLSVRKLVFPPEGSTDSALPTPPHRLAFTFKFKDYAPRVFRRIRQRFEIDEADFMLSLAGDFNYIEFFANSKSGQFFFYSHDGKYFIKTQTKEESKLLRQMLPQYYEHIMLHPNSMVARFLGMHRVKMRYLQQKMHFVVMSSVFDTPKPIQIQYDLKGSTVGRETSDEDKAKGCVQKDLDFVKSNMKIKLGPNKAIFIQTLQDDVAFLQSLNVMDYSILLGIHDEQSHRLGKRLKSVRLKSDATFMSGSSGDHMPQIDDSDSNKSKHSSQSSPSRGARHTPGKSAIDTIHENETKGELNLDDIPHLVIVDSQDTPEGHGPAANGGDNDLDKESMTESTVSTEESTPSRSVSVFSTYSNAARREQEAKLDKLEEDHFSGQHVGSVFLEDFGGIRGQHADGTPGTVIYVMGIIDILQRYNAKKRAENFFKGFRYNRREISAVDSQLYGTRFIHFFDSHTE